MSQRLFVPKDSTAAALGADGIANTLQTHLGNTDIVRCGSRGMYWAEPLLEVEVSGRRHGFGPLTLKKSLELGESNLLTATDPAEFAKHPQYIGIVDEHPYLVRQTRSLYVRAGVIDPLDMAAYETTGGLVGLHNAISVSSEQIIDQIDEAGLRGRGGAAFPAAIKLRTAADASKPEKYIVCNADEGDSGTFADRLLMEADPFGLIEGMVIAGLAVGAENGFVYLRSEYPLTADIFNQALIAARARGVLGSDVLGSRRAFDIHLRIGAGAYICGEETSLLESIEGRRAEVRTKPPLPVHQGLFGAPTVINNVLTLASMPVILAHGPAAFRANGKGRSTGTQPFQLAGNIRRGGLFEAPFGISLRTLIEEIGGGSASGRPIKAVQTGGPLGMYLGPAQLDVAMTYEDLADAGGLLGHGGIVVFDDSVDMAEQARFAMEFCSIESCGKCTPCRIGSTRGVEIMDRIRAGQNVESEIQLLDELCETMEDASLCAMGSMTPNPVRSALALCPDDFGLVGEPKEERNA